MKSARELVESCISDSQVSEKDFVKLVELVDRWRARAIVYSEFADEQREKNERMLDDARQLTH